MKFTQLRGKEDEPIGSVVFYTPVISTLSDPPKNYAAIMGFDFRKLGKESSLYSQHLPLIKPLLKQNILPITSFFTFFKDEEKIYNFPIMGNYDLFKNTKSDYQIVDSSDEEDLEEILTKSFRRYFFSYASFLKINSKKNSSHDDTIPKDFDLSDIPGWNR